MSAGKTAWTRKGGFPATVSSIFMVIVTAFAAIVVTAGPAAAVACLGGTFAVDHTDPDYFEVEVGKTLNIAAPGLLVGATPANKVRVYPPDSETVSSESGAQISYPNMAGAFRYVPQAGVTFTGGDIFEYAIVEKDCDLEEALSDEAWGYAEVVVKPIIVADTYNMVGGTLVVPEATGLLANDKGANPDSVLIDWSTGVGDIDDSAGGGAFTYTAPPDFSGVDTFTYEVWDLDFDYMYTGTLAINVAGCAPLTVKPQQYNLNFGQSLNVAAPGLLTGSTGTNRRIQIAGDPTPSDVLSAAGAAISHGTGGAFTYTPGPPYSGTDQFIYSATDLCGNEESELVTVNVKPVITADSFTVVPGSSTTSGNVLANDQGVNPATIDIDATSTQGGTIANNGNGAFEYTRAIGSLGGVDTFKYRVKDLSSEVTYTGNVTVNVQNTGNPPGEPVIVSATPGDGFVTVDWNAAPDNGNPIAGYRVTRSPDNKTWDVPATPTLRKFSDLDNGTQYTFTVRAHSAGGFGPSDSVTATPRTVPGKPSSVRASVSGSTITVTWNGPSNGGASIQRSKVTASNGTVAWVAGSGRSARFTGMKPGSYSFTVRSMNVAGWGPSSSRSSSVVIAQKITSPTYTARFTASEYAYLQKTARHFGMSVNAVAKTGVAVIRFILAIAPHPPTRAAARPQNSGPAIATAKYSVSENTSTMVPVSRYLVLNGNDTLKVGAALMQYFAALQGVR